MVNFFVAMWWRWSFFEVVRRHNGPSPKTLDSDENRSKVTKMKATWGNLKKFGTTSGQLWDDSGGILRQLWDNLGQLSNNFGTFLSNIGEILGQLLTLLLPPSSIPMPPSFPTLPIHSPSLVLIPPGWQKLAAFQLGQKWPLKFLSGTYLLFSRQMRRFCT